MVIRPHQDGTARHSPLTIRSSLLAACE